MALPVCPTDCSSTLPEVCGDICNPSIKYGGFKSIYFTNVGYPLTDAEDPAEWAARISQDSTAPDAIRRLFVRGDLPAPTKNEFEISGCRTYYGKSEFAANITIDDLCDENYEAVRTIDACKSSFLFWIETCDGCLYGGDCVNEGIVGTLNLSLIIPESNKELKEITGTLEWDGVTLPDVIDSPIQD